MNNAHWSNTGKSLRITPVFVESPSIDARVFIAFIIYMMHWSWETFYIAIGIVVFFMALEWMRLPFPMAVRRIRRALTVFLSGPHRPPRRVKLL